MYHSDYEKVHYFNKIEISKMVQNYRFTNEDRQCLITLQPLALANLSQFLTGYYDFIFSFEHAKTFIHSDALKAKHKEGITAWFLALFSGTYDEQYFRRLGIISETHVKIGLPSHYVNSAFSYVRQFLAKLLLKTNNIHALSAMHKIIDINLDILSLTYKEKKQQQLLKDIVLIKRVISEKMVIPYIQPIVNSKDEKVVKYECLMRLQDPTTGEIHSIYPYLHTAKTILLYEDLMRLMIEECFDVFSTNDVTFSINLSYEDIVNSAFYKYLHQKIKDFPNPERIIFEILETDSIMDFNIVLAFIIEMRKLGCRIAIDDFGSGYSNIENILKFKPDFIKIDGSLIKDLDHSEESFNIVKNVINIAKDMHAQTIAEYVHSQDVYDIVKGLEIDYLQGYYLRKPFPITELVDILG